MERASVEAIVGGLNEAGVWYLVVGGLAVVAHGYLRFTADLHLVLDLEADNLQRALRVFGGLGYRPRAPVDLREFADAATRESWVREKGLTVFSLFSPEHAATEIDLFVEPPFDFERAYASSSRLELAPEIMATFVGLDDLVELKKKAGRSQDLTDIEKLMALQRRRKD